MWATADSDTLKALTDALGNPVYVLEVESPDRFRVLCLNRSCEALFGLSHTRTCGHLVEEVLPEGLLERALARNRECITSGRAVAYEECIHHRDGVRWYQAILTPIRDDRGQPARILGNASDITARVAAETALRRSELQLRELVAGMPAVLFQWYARSNGERGLYHITERCEALTGFSRAALLADWECLPVHPDDREAFLASIDAAVTAGSDWNTQLRLLRPDGSIRWLRAWSHPAEKDAGEIVYTGVLLDVTDEQSAEQAARNSSRRLRTLMDNLPVIIAYTDRDLRYQYANRTYFEWFQVEPAELQGQRSPDFLGPEAYRVAKPYFDAALRGERVTFELDAFREEGPRHMEVSYVPDKSEAGEVCGIFVLAHDITTRKEQARELELQVSRDALTGLLNRPGLIERMEREFATERNGQPAVALFIDLDDFKRINDTYGHQMGDILLSRVAERLSGSVRTSDTVARIGGDEFVILLSGMQRETIDHHVQEFARKVLARMEAPYSVGNETLHLTVSIGVAVSDRCDAADLIHRADQAMYRTKRGGKRGYHVLFDHPEWPL